MVGKFDVLSHNDGFWINDENLCTMGIVKVPKDEALKSLPYGWELVSSDDTMATVKRDHQGQGRMGRDVRERRL